MRSAAGSPASPPELPLAAAGGLAAAAGTPAIGMATPAAAAGAAGAPSSYCDWTSDEEGEDAALLLPGVGGAAAAAAGYHEPVAPATVSAVEGGALDAAGLLGGDAASAGGSGAAQLRGGSGAGAGGRGGALDHDTAVAVAALAAAADDEGEAGTRAAVLWREDDCSGAGGWGRGDRRGVCSARSCARGREACARPPDWPRPACCPGPLAMPTYLSPDTPGSAEDAADPEWQARPKARGRPRKRRPSSGAGGVSSRGRNVSLGLPLALGGRGAREGRGVRWRAPEGAWSQLRRAAASGRRAAFGAACLGCGAGLAGERALCEVWSSWLHPLRLAGWRPAGRRPAELRALRHDRHAALVEGQLPHGHALQRMRHLAQAPRCALRCTARLSLKIFWLRCFGADCG